MERSFRAKGLKVVEVKSVAGTGWTGACLYSEKKQ
jgi:hypothetical protein